MKNKIKKTWKQGDTVKVRIQRMGGGAYAKAGSTSLPLVECVINQVNVVALAGCYSLRYKDTGEHVGLPFWASDFEE